MDTTEHNCEGAGGQLNFWEETFTCADCGEARAATKDELADYRKMLDEESGMHDIHEYMRDLQDTQDALDSEHLI